MRKSDTWLSNDNNLFHGFLKHTLVNLQGKTLKYLSGDKYKKCNMGMNILFQKTLPEETSRQSKYHNKMM